MCSFADCNVLSGWFLWSPAWLWGVHKPTWAVTQKCSSHKGDNSAPSTSRLCLVPETEGRGDINFAPSKPQLTKMRAAMINIIISLFLRQIYQHQKLRISIFTGWFRDVPIPLQMASRSAPVPSLQLLCTLTHKHPIHHSTPTYLPVFLAHKLSSVRGYLQSKVTYNTKEAAINNVEIFIVPLSWARALLGQLCKSLPSI